MSRLTPLSAARLFKIMKHLGFEIIRQKGSHTFWRHPDGRTTVIPFHKGEDLGRGLMKEILKDIELSVEDFNELKTKI